MDLSKSLQQIEGEDWGEPRYAPTSMVRRCLELRRVPLKSLSAEDCRLLLGQQISAPLIVPIALDFLEDDPMEGGIMLPGTLLRNVLNLPEEFWRAYPALWWRAKEVVSEVQSLREEIEELVPAMERFEKFGDG